MSTVPISVLMLLILTADNINNIQQNKSGHCAAFGTLQMGKGKGIDSTCVSNKTKWLKWTVRETSLYALVFSLNLGLMLVLNLGLRDSTLSGGAVCGFFCIQVMIHLC